jgi:ABC-type molybdate transport system permease subunit
MNTNKKTIAITAGFAIILDALVAGFSDILVHCLQLILPNIKDSIKTLNTILALPMALGEFGLAFWLIFKAAKQNVENKYPTISNFKILSIRESINIR